MFLTFHIRNDESKEVEQSRPFVERKSRVLFLQRGDQRPSLFTESRLAHERCYRDSLSLNRKDTPGELRFLDHRRGEGIRESHPVTYFIECISKINDSLYTFELNAFFELWATSLKSWWSIKRNLPATFVASSKRIIATAADLLKNFSFFFFVFRWFLVLTVFHLLEIVRGSMNFP